MSPRTAYSEPAGQAAHIGFGAAALALPYLTWYQAIVLAGAAVVLSVRMYRRLRRAGGSAMPPAGMFLYPASIVALLLVFPDRPDIVAAAWAMLAFGDGLATVVGRRFGWRSWPWNPAKTVGGSVAFVLAGGTTAAFAAWWCRGSVVPPPYIWFSIGAPLVAALVCAAAETTRLRIDDNVLVPFTAAATLWASSLVAEDLVVAFAAHAPGALPYAAGVNGAAGLIGHRLRVVTGAGAVTGAAIGIVVAVAAGWGAWLLLVAALATAVVTSRAGLQRKTRLGIEQEHGGRRGPGNALANTGVAAVAALLSVLSYAQDAATLALAAALVAGASDTAASEIGKAWGTRPWTLMPAKRAVAGTPGAMSFAGTTAGLAAAALLAVLAAVVKVVEVEAVPSIVVGATAGAMLESLLATTLERAAILDNDALNLINTAFAAFVAVAFYGATA